MRNASAEIRRRRVSSIWSTTIDKIRKNGTIADGKTGQLFENQIISARFDQYQTACRPISDNIRRPLVLSIRVDIGRISILGILYYCTPSGNLDNPRRHGIISIQSPTQPHSTSLDTTPTLDPTPTRSHSTPLRVHRSP